MSLNNNFPRAPENYSNKEEYIRNLKISVNYAMSGKTNNTGEITLEASETSSTFIDNLCNANSAVLLVPVTATAASATGVYVVAGNKQFTVNHNSTADTDRTFRYVIVG